MSNTIGTENSGTIFQVFSCFKEFFKLGTFLLLSALTLGACQGQSSSKAQSSQQISPAKLSSDQEQVQDKNEKGCQRIGERCRLRPGVLGICSPSSPQSEAVAPWASPASSKRLHCTPQH